MITFQRGEDPIRVDALYLVDGILVDPGTSIKVTITDEMGTAVVDAVAMTKDDDGKFFYNYTPEATAILGNYRVRVETDDVVGVVIEDVCFLLEG